MSAITKFMVIYIKKLICTCKSCMIIECTPIHDSILYFYITEQCITEQYTDNNYARIILTLDYRSCSKQHHTLDILAKIFIP